MIRTFRQKKGARNLRNEENDEESLFQQRVVLNMIHDFFISFDLELGHVQIRKNGRSSTGSDILYQQFNEEKKLKKSKAAQCGV